MKYETKNKKITFIIAIIGFILISLLFLILIFKDYPQSYSAYIENCEETTLKCTEYMKVEVLTFGNETMPLNALNKQFLDENCLILKDDYWACGKYLIQAD